MILAGVRVLSFTTGIAGPNAGRILASLGAEVIKVESKRGGIDAFRYFGTGDDLNSSARFAEANLGVRSVTIDLKQPAGLDVARRLAGICDIVLDNYRPGVLERIGLGYPDLRALRRDIIVVKMPGLGSTGPMKSFGTWGALLNAYSGLTWLWNFPDAVTPVGNQGVFPDYLSSALAPMVAVSALIRRQASGEGCVIDLAQSEATAFCALPISMLQVSVTGQDPERVGNRSRGPEVQGVYPCEGDDRWCAVRVETDEQWSRLLEIAGRPELLEEGPLRTLAAARANHDQADEMISAWTCGRSPTEAMMTLQAAGIAAALVASGADMLADPQLDRRGFIRRFEQPGVGEMVVPGLPLEIYPPLLEEPRPAAALGADNEFVIKGLLGMSNADYQTLVADDILV